MIQATPKPDSARARHWPWAVSALVWGTVAALAGTQQWAELKGTAKELAWGQAFLWQGMSWVLMVPATPLLFALVRRWPVDRLHPRRAFIHGLCGLAFGVLFLAASVPTRLAFHPSPLRWSLFGQAFYKSIPQCVVIGAATYWLVVVVASLVETRARLYATIVRTQDPPKKTSDGAIESGPATEPSTISTAGSLTLETPIGLTRQRLAAALWAEPAPAGARLHTDDGPVLLRHTLAELEALLRDSGFVRVHRGCLVNSSRVREVIGSPSRDGSLRLDTGASLPVSRRRRSALDGLLGVTARAPVRPEAAPLGE